MSELHFKQNKKTKTKILKEKITFVSELKYELAIVLFDGGCMCCTYIMFCSIEIKDGMLAKNVNSF